MPLYVILLIIVSKMKIDNLNKVFYFLLSISIFIELYFNIDSAGSGGFIADFKSTWPLVENPLNFSTNLDIKFPLHYYIAAVIYKLSNDKEIFRFVYCLISLVIPYLFFLCLKIKFKEKMEKPWNEFSKQNQFHH